MCRTDVAEQAEPTLAGLLFDMAAALAAKQGVDPRDVTIGPVDFGPADE